MPDTHSTAAAFTRSRRSAVHLVIAACAGFAACEPNVGPLQRRPLPEPAVDTGPPSGLAWSDPAPITSVEGLAWRVGGGSLAAGRDGRIHLVVSTLAAAGRWFDVHHTEYADGAWRAATNVSRSPDMASREARIGIDVRGDLHVVWGELPAAIQLSDPRELLYAVRPVGTSSWSTPQLAMPTSGAAFVPPTDVAAAPDGSIHIAYEPATPSRATDGPRHLRRDASGTWSTPVQVGPDRARGASIAVAPDGRVWLATSGAAPVLGASGSGFHSVLLSSSIDDGRTWDEPRVIHRAGTFAASSPRVVIASDGAIHVVWAQDRIGNPLQHPNEVWHSHSRDGGASWSTPVAVGGRSGFVDELRLVPDASGSVHLAFRSAGGFISPSGAAVYARWRGGQWSMSQRMLNGTDTATRMEIAVVGDTLHAVIQARDPNVTELVARYYHLRAGLR